MNSSKKSNENDSIDKEIHESGHKKIYCWIFSLLLITIIVVIYVISDIFYHCNVTFKDLKEINTIISTLLTVIGVFIAFTAINIYSIFNARVDEEKRNLRKLRNKYSNIFKRINDENIELKEKLDGSYSLSIELKKDLEKLRNESESIKSSIESNQSDNNELRNELLILISINNIITDYISIKDKGTAVGTIQMEIYSLDNKINKSDSLSEKKDLEGKQIELVKKIHTAIYGYYQSQKNEMKNVYYKRMLDGLMNKLNEIRKKHGIEDEKQIEDSINLVDISSIQNLNIEGAESVDIDQKEDSYSKASEQQH